MSSESNNSCSEFSGKQSRRVILGKLGKLGTNTALSLAGTSSLSNAAGQAIPKAIGVPYSETPNQPRLARAFQLGIDHLAYTGFRALRGKRVGLVCHQASISAAGIPSRVIMHRDPRVNLVSLFSPEHGIEGVVTAGRSVKSSRDRLTGLPVHSLYGRTRKPSRSMLRDIDVLVFDLQDIGTRYYTYISTMFLCMEACGQHRKTFLIMDRPNPLGGTRIEGPSLERRWTSFVGQFPVPIVHGMTAGELAQMIHGERWIRRRPRLQIAKMNGWSRQMNWNHTGLRWHKTSPNIPNWDSPFYYAATGMLGGMAGVDVGTGGARPFTYALSSRINAKELSRRLYSWNIPGVGYKPYYKSGYAGVKLKLNTNRCGNLTALDVILMAEINRQQGGALVKRTKGNQRDLFNKVYGSEELYALLRSKKNPAQLIASWESNCRGFARARHRYLLYS